MAENKQPIIDKSKSGLKSFPSQYWLTIMFEFFERGSYYGMMSVLAVYLTDILGFSKEGVGVITGTIQPILYFLPIISGALADRFGYRKALTVAFALLGTGYFLTSQMTGYTTVFLSLSVMALGAGTFKPIISGSIARMTTKENSSLGFGVFYWTINLGAFLFPLFLIPYLKNNIGWNWVFIAAALGTGAMLIPTLLFFKEPPRPKDEKKKETNLVQTIANAFEIIYSPFILISNQLKARNGRGILAYAFIALFGIGAVYSYLQIPTVEEKLNSHVFSVAGNALMITVDRNVMGSRDYAITARERQTFPPYTLTLMTEAKNDRRELFAPVAQDGNDLALMLYSTNLDSIFTLVASELKPFFVVERDTLELMVQNLLTRENNQFDLTIYKPDAFEKFAAELLTQLQENPG
ncbi:MFS transporter, partial [bacterium]|nr:MFS transporter [bacterium]